MGLACSWRSLSRPKHCINSMHKSIHRFVYCVVIIIVYCNWFTLIIIYSFSFHGIGPIYRLDNRLNRESYGHFLETAILPEIESHFDDGNVHLFHDNHPVHNSNYVKEWITANIGPINDFVIPHPRYYILKFIVFILLNILILPW